jgi:hypothetical protein
MGICVFSLLTGPLHADQPGTSTANFLNIGVGGRAAGMGEAQVAVANDASATYWNPAALGNLPLKEIMAMHNSIFQDTSFDYLSYAHPTRDLGTFAGSLSAVTVSAIQGYDANDTPTQTLSASDFLLGGHWGRTQVLNSGSLSYGGSVKYLNKRLGTDSAQTTMVDGGLLWKPSWEPLKHLQTGFVIQNLGPGLKFVSDTNPLPTTVRWGVGYSLLENHLTLALDVLAPRDNSPGVNTGLEYRIFDLIALRAGYQGSQHDIGSNFTLGAGVNWSSFRFDYGFASYGDLGATHRISFGVRFGHNPKEAEPAVAPKRLYVELNPPASPQRSGTDSGFLRTDQDTAEGMRVKPDSLEVAGLLAECQQLRQSRKLESKDLYRRGLKSLKGNDKDEAFSLWQKAAMLDPENQEVRRRLENFRNE